MSGDRSANRVWTPSNIITICRIMLVPVFVGALLAPWPDWFGLDPAFTNNWKAFVAAAVFVGISCTDWLDGYLARSRNEVTDFGKFMDPLADKILVAAALISLVELGSLPTWVALIILAREFIVSGLRMMAATKGVVIAASMLGKFKTVFQMIAIVLFTIKDSHMIGGFSSALSDTLWLVSWIVMLIALVLTIASMVDYLVKGCELLGFSGDGSGFTAVGDGDAVQPGIALSPKLADKARELVEAAVSKGLTVSTAESLTGGLIGAAITDIAGSSQMFKGGVMSYTNEVKHGLLGVDDDVLAAEGAVCEAVAMQMAEGARRVTGSDLAVSVTGIAGPGGAEPGKPVGTVWMGLSTAKGTRAQMFIFDGMREEVREQTAEKALEALLDEVDAAVMGS